MKKSTLGLLLLIVLILGFSSCKKDRYDDEPRENLFENADVDLIREKITSDNDLERADAVKMLGFKGDKSDGVALIKALNDSETEVRLAACESLGWLAYQPAVENLIKKLEDTDEDEIVRAKAVFALGMIRDLSVIPAMVKAIDYSEKIRSSAVGALSNMEGSEAAKGLVKALEYEDSLRMAAQGLEFIGDKTAVAGIVKKLESPELKDKSSIKRKLIGALEHIADDSYVEPLIKILENDVDKDLRNAAVWALSRCKGEKVVKSLIKAMQTDTDIVVRLIVPEALGRVGDKSAAPALIEQLDKHLADTKMLKQDKINSVISISKTLGLIGDKSATPVLLKAVKAGYPEAVSAIMQIGDAGCISELRKELKHEKANVRSRIIYAIYEFDKEAAKEDFSKQLLAETDEQVKILLAQMLVILGINENKEKFDFIVEMLKNKDSDVGRAAAIALGNIGDKAAIKPLIEQLNRKYVSLEAARALALIPDESAVEPLIKALRNLLSQEYKYTQDIKAMILALQNIGSKKAVPVLVEVIATLKQINEGEDRENAVNALVALNAKEAIEPLQKLFKEAVIYDAPNIPVKITCAEALYRLGSPDKDAMIKFILDTAKNMKDLIRSDVAFALGNIGSKDYLETLQKLRNDPSSHTRYEAKDALEKIKN